ncbi:glycoside hydrolase family 16 protein [Diaporthe amygdali]|uniref:glycoside hydrolase family 16 protein n=1 Tax=Phomopsis amygdali TaxID=1214568 RepID=UPI0022FE7B90|nr:glycoside hydrolase family 16 protein [Diaporthe amygdali]KAJ0121532.1 glycoside hydrolase family 16 protein [Diaporthe amygdali]
MFLPRSLRAAATAALLASFAAAQTSTDCNPTQTTCDADPALGMAIDVDFTQGEVNSFTASGGTPTYGSDGVTFTISKSGDAPQLNSVFYIMFGKVDITLKCASGTGIVTSVVLQSDDLDEIDMEFLGVDNSQVQLMYFGKGQRATDPLVYAAAPNNQDEFVTYSVDWTSERIVWSVGGTDVRVLEASTYPDYYPQTPMQLKFGIWAGGDPSNSEGTISWAGGSTDYSQGPFSAAVQKVEVTDYSTGSKYSYGDMSGTWESIKSDNGEINANAGQAATVTTVSGSTSTGSSNFPGSGISGGSSTSVSSVDAIPSGWRMTSSGKIVPNSSTAGPLTTSSSPASSASPSSQPGAAAGGEETITTWDGQGFLTTMTVASGWATASKSYDDQGFPVSTSAPEAPPLAAADPNSRAGSKTAVSGGARSASATPCGLWLQLTAPLVLFLAGMIAI